MPRLHPRHIPVTVAGRDLEARLWDIQEDLGLSYLQMGAALAVHVALAQLAVPGGDPQAQVEAAGMPALEEIGKVCDIIRAAHPKLTGHELTELLIAHQARMARYVVRLERGE